MDRWEALRHRGSPKTQDLDADAVCGPGNLAFGYHVGPRCRPGNGTWSLVGYGHKAGHNMVIYCSLDPFQSLKVQAY